MVQQIRKYLAGKHDDSKKRIAEAALVSIPLSVTYSELLKVLTVFQQELAMLVAAKNARRWFKHKAGAFDKLLGKGIERCQKFAQTENRIGQGLTDSKEAITLKDWNRNNGGRAFLVNSVGFAISKPSIRDIDGFLNTNGIKNAKIRHFICNFSNQDGLHAVAHLFPLATREATGCIPSQAPGKTHEYTTTSVRKIHVKDTFPWNMFLSSKGQPYECNPAIPLIVEYDLVEAGGKVQVSGASLSFGNLTGAPPALRKKLPDVLPILKTIQG